MAPQVLVIGGTGRTGSYVVQQLGGVGYAVRVLARDAARARQQLGTSVAIVAGDITDARRVTTAMMAVDGVVIVVESANDEHAPNSPERVHDVGTRNVISAAAPHTQIVLVTQIYITRPERYPAARAIIHWRQRAEDSLRASGLPYTIVRPAWLTDAPAGQQAVHLEQGDRGDGEIARADVASACVEALQHAEARGKTFEIYNQPGAPQNWTTWFSALQPDDTARR